VKVRARRARAMLRYRRRGYGPSHAPLCRCPECVDYGYPVISPLTDYDRYLLDYYLGGRQP
jgi:hypothetical protein